MRTSCFDYELPDHCIARHPTVERDGARMLVLERASLVDDMVRNFSERVPAGSLLVINDTRVRRARVLGKRRDTGGKVELLLLERSKGAVSCDGEEHWSALGRPLRSLRPGTHIDVEGLILRVVGRGNDGQLSIVARSVANGDVEAALEKHGHVPIPPYLGRVDQESDITRYQTVFAEHQGSVAAPTAGLHLTHQAIRRLEARGVEIGRVTLHVGVGTFRPVAVDDLDAHPMHSEWFHVGAELERQVGAARARNGRVIAVGTTAVRALESAADMTRPGHVRRIAEYTNLLIQPGYSFRVVQGLLTNFHQPRSTLLALVAAAVGTDRVREAYCAAIERGYRFLSYGDAMWIPEFVR